MSEYVQAEISLNETTRDLLCELIDVLRDRLPERPAEDTRSDAERMVERLSPAEPSPAPEEYECSDCGEPREINSDKICRCGAPRYRWRVRKPSPAPEGEYKPTPAEAYRDAIHGVLSTNHIGLAPSDLAREIAQLRAEVEEYAGKAHALRLRAEKAEQALAEAQAADGEATALLRELDAAKEERDEAQRECEQWSVTCTRHREAQSAAEAREKGLREALVTYGRHNTACDVVTKGATAPCDCGLDAALARDGGEEA